MGPSVQPPRLRAAIPTFTPPAPAPKAKATKKPVRIDIVESQASAAREAYLAERLAQIDGWSYDQRPWGPVEMPVPSSLPFGRDPRGRVRARVEDVMREAATAAKQAQPQVPVAAEKPVEKEKPAEKPADEEKEAKPKSIKDKRRWSMLSIKSAAEAPEPSPAPAPKSEKAEKPPERGPPSAFRRWSVLKPNDASEAPPKYPSKPASTHTRSASEAPPIPPVAPAPLKRNRRWSLQNLKDVLTRDKEAEEIVPAKLEVEQPKENAKEDAKETSKEETIITHLPERSSSISPTKPKKSGSTLPSPSMSLVSLDIDFDMFGLSSDSQSVKTPPESSEAPPEPAAPKVEEHAPAHDPQLVAERDAWRHEALLLYDQLCYWRLEALERGRERDGWRGVAIAAGAKVPACVVKSLPVAAAPLSDAQRRAREVEREREKGRERVREWHLASIEREKREHAAREAEKRAASREMAERRELERRVMERRARERHIELREMARRDAERQAEWAEYQRRERRHSRQPSREWAVPSPAAEAAADAMAIVGAAPAGVLPPPGLPGHVSSMTGSWGRQSRRSSHGGPMHDGRFPPGHDHSGGLPEHEHDARPRAVGWPASESGRERARELFTPPRGSSRQAVRSGTA
jgi:hypothetical protein